MLIKRESSRRANDLHTVYRPCRIDEVVGNDFAKNKIKKGLSTNSLSHTIMFVGQAGCGKTTLARIVALSLNCVNGPSSEPCLECSNCRAILDSRSFDVQEVNAGTEGGKAAVEAVIRDLPYAPSDCTYKVIIFDEAHEITKSAQDALLKPMEDGYSHVYLVFCTNQPDKLLPTFTGRCDITQFGRLKVSEILDILTNVCDFEGAPYKKEVLNYLSVECSGVPRQALLWLKSVIDEGSWDLEIVKVLTIGVGGKEEAQAIEIAKLVYNGDFNKAVKLYDSLKLPVEKVRPVISGFFAYKLKVGGPEQKLRCSRILDLFTTPIYEPGKTADHKICNNMFKACLIMEGKI